MLFFPYNWNLISLFLILILKLNSVVGEEYIEKDLGSLRYSTLKHPIIKPPGDVRSYEVIKISNQLEAVLISDPHAEKFKLSMDILGAGAINDPSDLLGLTNLLQKLILNEPSFQTYISTNNGIIYGNVTYDKTRIQLELPRDKLQEGMRKFSNFFCNPDFSISNIDKMILKLDEEFKLMMSDDYIILKRIQAYFTDGEISTYDRFRFGSFQSLKPLETNINIHDELFRLYNSHYSTNLMRLVLISSDNIDTIRSTIIENLSKWTNRNLPLPQPIKNPITKDYQGVIISSVPNSGPEILRLEFTIPNPYLHKDSLAYDFLINILNWESDNSMIKVLRSLNWADRLESRVTEYFQDTAILEFTFYPLSDGIGNKIIICLSRMI